MEGKKESKLTDYPNTISYETSKKILEQMEKNICKIFVEKDQGTGFFCKIPLIGDNASLHVLISNNHIINRESLYKKDSKISLYIEEKMKIKIIDLNNRIKYTNENYDISIIEIKESDEIQNYLEIDDIIMKEISDNKNRNDKYIDKTIYTIQYPEGELSVSYGVLSSIFLDKEYNFLHKCNTKKGSSGSPVLNMNNKVIGIHKEGIDGQYNIGSFLNFPIKEFIEQNSTNIKRIINKKNFNTNLSINFSKESNEVKKGKKLNEKDEKNKINLKITLDSINQQKKYLSDLSESIFKREKSIKEKENEFEKKNSELIESQKKLIKTKEENDKIIKNIIKAKENLNKREIKLDEKEYIIKIKEKELEEKNRINLRTKEEIIEKQKIIINKEKTLKEKEEELDKKNLELIQHQKNFLKHSLLEEEKKNLEKKIKKFELSKIPNEVGLQNIGATCYMNATLQALSNTDSFTEYFLTKYHFEPSNYDKRMSNEMYKVLSNLWDENKKKGDYPPYDFKNTLNEENSLFAGIQANDSKDLINFLLERFHQEMNNPPQKQINDNYIVNQMNEAETLNAFVQDYFNSNKSIITDCFYGIIETKSTCSGCNITKYNFQIYSFLEFPLKEVNAFMHQSGKREALINQDGTNPDIDIYECFDYNQKLDLMTGQNQMYCNTCNCNSDAYYGTTIYSLPNYIKCLN